ADLVITVGGCGLSRWDCAPEAACAAAERAVPGLSAALRAGWLALSQNAVLDRGTAVIRGGALIVNLPGDPAVLPALLETLLAAVGDNAFFSGRPHAPCPRK
ncbi:MogA/MoaB family molybdenum cofactor biosynthesis protein, partial [Pseudoflavonifractor sp. BIOML-A16]|nr:MogA/MoaB family molybdenum cofactor biosynthesis protein [Pseudoflavonifractor sp. BIOML-A16]